MANTKIRKRFNAFYQLLTHVFNVGNKLGITCVLNKLILNSLNINK